jgi:hypothetical protein
MTTTMTTTMTTITPVTIPNTDIPATKHTFAGTDGLTGIEVCSYKEYAEGTIPYNRKCALKGAQEALHVRRASGNATGITTCTKPLSLFYPHREQIGSMGEFPIVFLDADGIKRVVLVSYDNSTDVAKEAFPFPPIPVLPTDEMTEYLINKSLEHFE